MKSFGGTLERAVSAGFEKLGVDALAERPGRWRLMLVNGRPLSASARLADGWIEIEAALGAIADRSGPWEWLVTGAALPGPAKLVLDGTRLAARAELRADSGEATLRARLGEACGSLLAAARLAADAKENEPAGTRATPDTTPSAELAAQLAERRWVARERAPGCWTVELGGSAHPAAAELGRDAAGGTTLTVVVAPGRERAPASRAALASYLLESARQLRLVRAAGAADGAARFEVRFESEPEPSELDEALGALDVAARFCLPAAARLEEAATSRWYLAACDPARAGTPRSRRDTTTGRAERGGGR
jgi:hypothetical protein